MRTEEGLFSGLDFVISTPKIRLRFLSNTLTQDSDPNFASEERFENMYSLPLMTTDLINADFST